MPSSQGNIETARKVIEIMKKQLDNCSEKERENILEAIERYEKDLGNTEGEKELGK